jgi:cytochrome P450
MIISYTLNGIFLFVMFQLQYLTGREVIFSAVLLSSVYLMTAIFLRQRKKFKSIPYIPADSILGYTATLLPDENVHEVYLRNAEHYGPVYSSSFMWRNIVTICDMRLAKDALRNVVNKGFFHQPNPHMMNKNVLNMDTGAAHSLRRDIFSRAMNQSALRRRSDEVDALVESFLAKLRVYEKIGETVPIDRLFGQLTVDIISEVGLSYHIGALENSGKTNCLTCRQNN